MNFRTLVLTALAALAGGCTVYRPLPLRDNAVFLNDISHVVVDRSAMSLPELQQHVFDPSDGLDETEVAMLAVANSPVLRIARDTANVSRAQAFNAGLLPDPQFSYSIDRPVEAADDLVSAITRGLSFDLGALLKLPSARKGADAATRQADLDLLWQEWQVVSQARLLFSRVLFQRQTLLFLTEERSISSERYETVQKELEAGNVTSDAANADLATLQGIQTSIHTLELDMQKNSGDLNTLLGLEPDVPLNLVGDNQAPQLDPAVIAENLRHIAGRRPDLLALHAGYDSQEETFRQAVIAQFPAVNIGVNRAHDTSSVYTHGLSLAISLPIFNQNRGAIAIEKATRQKLHDEYQVRVNATYTEVTAILDRQTILAQQIEEATRGYVVLAKAAKDAQAAFEVGNIDSLAYVNVRNALRAKEIEMLTLRQTMMEDRIALVTLIGGSPPTRLVTHLAP